MRSSVGLVVALFVTGCHTYYVKEPDPLTSEEIIELTNQGLGPDEIIGKIRQSRTVYNMDFEDGVKLHENGVDKKVIDFMMKTRERALERRAYYHYPHYYPPYYYYPSIGFHYGYCW